MRCLDRRFNAAAHSEQLSDIVAASPRSDSNEQRSSADDIPCHSAAQFPRSHPLEALDKELHSPPATPPEETPLSSAAPSPAPWTPQPLGEGSLEDAAGSEPSLQQQPSQNSARELGPQLPLMVQNDKDEAGRLLELEAILADAEALHRDMGGVLESLRARINAFAKGEQPIKSCTKTGSEK